MVNMKRRMKAENEQVKVARKRKTSAAEFNNDNLHIEKGNCDSYGLYLSGVCSFENITDVFNDIKLRELQSDIPNVTLEYALKIVKSFISDQSGDISKNDGLALLEIANKFLLLFSTRTDVAVDEESVETILRGIKKFVVSKLWNNIRETKDKINDSKHSKRFKLCQDEINNRINSELVIFYDFLINLVERNVISEFGVHEVLSCTFFILSSVGSNETLNLKAIEMISMVYMKCESVRVSIMDDIFLIISRDLSTDQKSLLSIDGSQIMVLTALVMSVFQNMPPSQRNVKGATKGKNKSKSNIKISSDLNNQDDTYKNYLALSQGFTTNFYVKCCSSEDKGGAVLIERFLDDIIIMADHVQWPSSHLLLMTFYQVMMKIITSKTREACLRVTAFHLIGKIYKHLSSCIHSPKISGDVSKFSIDSLQATKMMIIKWIAQFDDKKNICDFHLVQWNYVDLLLNDPSTEGANVSSVDQVLKDSDIIDVQPGVLKEMYRLLNSKTWFSKVHHMLTIYMFQLASDDSIAIRLKAVQCLSHLVALNLDIIKQETFVHLVRTRIMDSAASVRSSVVEMIGCLVRKHEDSIDSYFEELSTSCMDISVSVRKQAVMSFRDFLLDRPKHRLLPEIMLCLLGRNSDEEHVKKHVMDIFKNFLVENDASHVCECFVKVIEKSPSQAALSLVENCFSSLIVMEKKASKKASIEKALKEIVGHASRTALNHCSVFRLKRSLSSCNQKELSNYLTLLTVLSGLKFSDWFEECIDGLIECCSLQFPVEIDVLLKLDILNILENHLSSSSSLENFKSSKLHNILFKFITFPSMKIIEKSLHCIVMLVSKGILEMLPVKESFMAMTDCLDKQIESDHKMKHDEIGKVVMASNLQQIKTNLFIVGMFSKFFDSTQLETNRLRTFEAFIHFVGSEDEDVRLKALCGLGFFLQRHSDLLLDEGLIQIMSNIIASSSSSPVSTVLCIMKYLENFFKDDTDSKNTSRRQDEKSNKTVSLKDMYENDSSSASRVVQVFLKQLLNNFLHSNISIRETSFDVISSILHQGLVHPAMCLPHLICACCSTKDSRNICLRAEMLLKAIQSKYPSIVGTSIIQGLRLSYRLNVVLQSDQVVRGRAEADGKIRSCFEIIFSLVHKNNAQCQSFIKSVLKCFYGGMNFEECSMNELLYIADALSCLPFASLEIVLFLINNIDLIVSSQGSNLLHDFVQILGLKQRFNKRSTQKKVKKCRRNDPNRNKIDDDDNDEDSKVSITKEQIRGAINNISNDNLKKFRDVCSMAHRCLLLIYLKNHLHKQFNINEREVQNYSKECKSLTRINSKAITTFQPELTTAFIKFGDDVNVIIDCFFELKSHFEESS